MVSKYNRGSEYPKHSEKGRFTHPYHVCSVAFISEVQGAGIEPPILYIFVICNITWNTHLILFASVDT